MIVSKKCGQYDTFGGANVPKPETFVKSESPEVPSLETFVNFRLEFRATLWKYGHSVMIVFKESSHSVASYAWISGRRRWRSGMV